MWLVTSSKTVTCPCSTTPLLGHPKHSMRGVSSTQARMNLGTSSTLTILVPILFRSQACVIFGRPSFAYSSCLICFVLGNAILVYGFSWSFFPSSYRVTLDNETSVTLYSASALPNTTSAGLSRIYTSGLTFFQANLTDLPHILTVDNNNGAGQIGLDYIEIISVTGGTLWVYCLICCGQLGLIFVCFSVGWVVLCLRHPPLP
jgi:hypothetical protein